MSQDVKDQNAEDAKLLIQFVAGRDMPCPRCDYNLRDLITDRCPECGDQLMLKVNRVEPRQGPLIAGLVGLSAGAGMGGMMLIFAVVMILHQGRIDRSDWSFIEVNSGGFVIEGVAVLLWLGRWKRLGQKPLYQQKRLALGCWLLTAVYLVAFIKFIN